MDYKNLPEKVRKLLDKYINGFFGLGDLNYIKPFRRLIHMILYRIHNAEVRLDEIEDSPTMEEFEDLEKRVETNEGNIDGLEENKVDKSDFEDLEAHVDDIDSEIDDLQTQIDDTNDDLSALEERVKTNEDNIEDLDEKKADKTALEETNNRVTELEDCCEEVGQHLEEVDGRLDKDEDNIDTLLDNMIVLTGHDGIIATDVYFENIYEIKIDDLLMQMLNAGIMEYCVYTACYDEWDNWVKQIQGAVKSIYDYEWNNFAFINVKAVHFGGTSPRPMIELIPRERDVYICLDYTGDDFVGHCFMHRTDLKELEERMTAAEGRLDTDEANIEQNTNDIERLTTDMEHTGERLTDIENAITALQKADDDFETRISYLEECCGDVKDTIGHLEDDIEDCRKHADAATEQAEQAAKDAEDAKEAAEEAEKKAEDAASKVDEFDERITTNTDNIEELQDCCEEVQGAITDIKQTAEEARESADNAKSEADTIKDAYIKKITHSTSSNGNNRYVSYTWTNQDDEQTQQIAGAVTGITVTSETDDTSGDVTYTVTEYYVSSNTAFNSRVISTITVPAGFDPSEIEAQLQEIVDKVNNDESDLEELKTTIENINVTITNLETKVEELEDKVPDEYVKEASIGYNNQTGTDGGADMDAYTSIELVDQDGNKTNGYCGSLSNILYNITHNDDGSITYELDIYHVRGKDSTAYKSQSLEIEVPGQNLEILDFSELEVGDEFICVINIKSCDTFTVNGAILDLSSLSFSNTVTSSLDLSGINIICNGIHTASSLNMVVGYAYVNEYALLFIIQVSDKGEPVSGTVTPQDYISFGSGHSNASYLYACESISGKNIVYGDCKFYKLS